VITSFVTRIMIFFRSLWALYCVRSL